MQWIITHAQRVNGIVDVRVKSHEAVNTIGLLEVIVLDEAEAPIGAAAEIRNIPPVGEGQAHIMVAGAEPLDSVVVIEILESGNGLRIEGRRHTARLAGPDHR